MCCAWVAFNPVSAHPQRFEPLAGVAGTCPPSRSGGGAHRAGAHCVAAWRGFGGKRWLAGGAWMSARCWRLSPCPACCACVHPPVPYRIVCNAGSGATTYTMHCSVCFSHRPIKETRMCRRGQCRHGPRRFPMLTSGETLTVRKCKAGSAAHSNQWHYLATAAVKRAVTRETMGRTAEQPCATAVAPHRWRSIAAVLKGGAKVDCGLHCCANRALRLFVGRQGQSSEGRR